MKKEQQDLAWACLPKEVRDEVIRCFKYASKNSKSDLQRGSADTLEHFFGSHNLTSDTEPAELLFVDSKDVKWRYARNNEVLARDPKNELSLSIKALFESLFGDKCLPDKEPSVQGEPNFRKGNKVKVVNDATHNGKIGEVINVVGSMIAVELDDGTCIVWHERYFEPYAEPETKDNTQQNSWDDAFKRFNECCNKIIKTLDSIGDSCDKLKGYINNL